MVKVLHKLGANLDAVDEKGRTALIIATLKGDVELVKVLHDAKADLNVRAKSGMTALFAVARASRRQTDMLKVH